MGTVLILNYKKLSYIHDELSIQKRFSTEKDGYHKELDTWCCLKDGSAFESKIRAKELILNSLAGCANRLDLSNLQLYSIPPLYALNKLRYLNLSHNCLKSCKQKTFQFNFCLEELNLSYNQFSDYHCRAIIQSDSLLKINLNHNCFEKLDANFFSKIPNIQRISLTQNNIFFIEDNAFLHRFLIELDLSYNQLNHFSSTILSKNTGLNRLNLDANLLTHFDIPDGFLSHCTISLKRNPIRLSKLANIYFSQYIDSYKKPLFELSIHTNKWGMISATSPTMSEIDTPILNDRFSIYLKSLNDWVHHNEGTPLEKKKQVQEYILSIVNKGPMASCDVTLKSINLCTIPPLFGLLNMKNLDLSNNRISKIDPTVFPIDSQLIKLDLSKNLLETFSEKAFERLKKLHELILSHNQLTFIDATYFSNLSYLKILILDHNAISDIDLEAFKFQTDLEYLCLSKNFFSRFQATCLRYICDLEILDLSDNRLIQFRWTSDNISEPSILLMGNLLSLNAIADLNAIQNSYDYCGPTYELSVASETLSTANVDINLLPFTLAMWNGNTIDSWKQLLDQIDTQKKNLINNLNIFLIRLHNEVPRDSNGSISVGIQFHVNCLLSALNNSRFDVDLITFFCNMASDALADCVDRIGITLIIMSLYAQRYEAKKNCNFDVEKKLNLQLSQLMKVVKFVNDVDAAKIVWNSEKKQFVPLTSLGIIDEIPVPIESVSIMDRYKKIAILNSKKNRLRYFNIKDAVEDILCIIRELRLRGLSDIESIDIRFGEIATLQKHLNEAVQYIINS